MPLLELCEPAFCTANVGVSKPAGASTADGCCAMEPIATSVPHATKEMNTVVLVLNLKSPVVENVCLLNMAEARNIPGSGGN